MGRWSTGMDSLCFKQVLDGLHCSQLMPAQYHFADESGRREKTRLGTQHLQPGFMKKIRKVTAGERFTLRNLPHN